MQKNKEFRFIRKNGRIIPIRVKQGAAEVGAGLGVGVASGIAAERLFAAGRKMQRASRIATKRAAISFAAGRLDANSLKMKKAVSTAKKASRLFKTSRAALFGGVIASGALIYSGIKTALPKNKQNDRVLDYVSHGAAGLGAIVSTRIFKRGLARSFPGLVL